MSEMSKRNSMTKICEARGQRKRAGQNRAQSIQHHITYVIESNSNSNSDSDSNSDTPH